MVTITATGQIRTRVGKEGIPMDVKNILDPITEDIRTILLHDSEMGRNMKQLQKEYQELENNIKHVADVVTDNSKIVQSSINAGFKDIKDEFHSIVSNLCVMS